MNTEDSLKRFNQFILKEENRGYLITFKGEANTTWFSFLFGLFSFVFTRRFTSLRTYEEHTISKVTRNYNDRLKLDKIETFNSETVKAVIVEMERVFSEKDKSFWSGNSSTHVQRARGIQRAKCYYNALIGATPQLVDSNPKNSFLGAIKGALHGFFGGLAGWTIWMGILFIALSIIIFIVELF